MKRVPVLLLLGVAFFVLFAADCAAQQAGWEEETARQRPSPSAALRELAGAHDGIEHVGTAADAGALQRNEQYAEVLAREFNAVTPENAMKWAPLRPSRATFDFEEADRLVAFAEKHDMDVRGHTLVWYRQLPAWLTSQDWSREELTDLLEEHIKTVASHYEEAFPGRVTSWDVVNEAIADGGGGGGEAELRENIWLQTIGPEYIAKAFEWAREAAPDAQLYYNDYNIAGGGAKADAVYDLVSGLVGEGVPIDGVGFQAHVSVQHAAPSPEALASNMERFEALGLDVAITELDVRIPLGDDGAPSQEQLAKQAAYYRRFMNACLAAPNCSDFRTWGFTDAESWVPGAFEGNGAALLFDAQYEPKPAYKALANALQNQD